MSQLIALNIKLIYNLLFPLSCTQRLSELLEVMDSTRSAATLVIVSVIDYLFIYLFVCFVYSKCIMHAFKLDICGLLSFVFS